MNMQDFSEQTTEELRVEIGKTRARLAHQATCLQSELSHATDQVREAASEKIEEAKKFLSYKYYMERYPWPIMALSVVAGAGLNRLVTTGKGKELEDGELINTHYSQPRGGRSSSSPKKSQSNPGLMSQLTNAFDSEINEVRERVVLGGMDLLGEIAHQTLPSAISKHFVNARNKVASNLRNH